MCFELRISSPRRVSKGSGLVKLSLPRMTGTGVGRGRDETYSRGHYGQPWSTLAPIMRLGKLGLVIQIPFCWMGTSRDLRVVWLERCVALQRADPDPSNG